MMRPKSIYLTCIHALPQAVPNLGIISFICLDKDRHVQSKYSGLWCLSMEQPQTMRSCHSLSFFSQTLHGHLEAVTQDEL